MARLLARAAWSQLLAGVALLPLGATSPPPGPIDAAVVANLLALALIVAGTALVALVGASPSGCRTEARLEQRV